MFLAVTKKTSQIFSNGAVVGLGVICILQYFVYLLRHVRQWQADRAMEKHLDQLNEQIVTIRQRKVATHHENTFLRRFISESDLPKAMDIVLECLVPTTDDKSHEASFACFLKIEGDTVHLWRSRGLDEAEEPTISLDETIREQLVRDGYVLLQDRDLLSCPLLDSFSPQLRSNMKQLFLFGIAHEDQLTGALMTTSLYPVEASRQTQISLFRRLTQSLAHRVGNSVALATRQTELQLTQEMLDLRGVSDQVFRDPREMTEAFLDRLIQIIGADRAALFLFCPGNPISCKPMVRCGDPFVSSVEARWIEFEQQLAEEQTTNRKHGLQRLSEDSPFASAGNLQIYNSAELESIGIDRLIGSALLAPLRRNDKVLGVICITRQQADQFTDSNGALVRWAAEYLAETILRVQRHVTAERRAGEDGLTQLANRRTFDERIRHEVKTAREQSTDCSLLFVDLDRFKLVNDTFSHQAGDEVLRVTAGILQREVARVRSTDSVLIARYGGEEMAIILPGVGIAGATRIGENIRATLEETPIQHKNKVFHVTLSVGIATCPCHADTVTDLLQAADAALYQAKRTGRNRVCTADGLANSATLDPGLDATQD